MSAGLHSSEEITELPIACKREENFDLFSSPELAPFDQLAYMEDHPEIDPENLTPEDQRNIDRAIKMHSVVQKSAEAAAKMVCKECPALKACFMYAMNFEDDTRTPVYGVLAGMNPKERRKARKQLALIKQKEAEHKTRDKELADAE